MEYVISGLGTQDSNTRACKKYIYHSLSLGYRFKLKQTMRYLTFAFAIQGARFEAQAEAHGSKNDISHFWSRSKVKHKIIFIHSSYMGLSDFEGISTKSS